MTETATEITPEELGDRLFDGGVRPVVVDVRPREDFEAWHIPGSEHVDVYEDLEADRDAASAALSSLPEERPIVTVCAAGILAEEATSLLREEGHDARTLVDGMRGWSRLHRSAPVAVDVAGTLIQVARPGKGCLSYVLVADGEAVVVDPSHHVEVYEGLLEREGATLVGVMDTHAHADHVSGGRELADRHGVPYHLHPADAAAIDATPVRDGSTIEVGDLEVAAIHTPGHSPGGVTYAIGDAALLSGDTLFHRSVGRVELGVEAGIDDADVRSNAGALYDSLQRLRRRAGDADPWILPAHDPGSPEPPITLRLSDVERRNDDLGLDREAFVERLAADLPDHPPNFERVKRANVGLDAIDDGDLSALELGPNRCAAE